MLLLHKSLFDLSVEHTICSFQPRNAKYYSAVTKYHLSRTVEYINILFSYNVVVNNFKAKELFDHAFEKRRFTSNFSLNVSSEHSCWR